VVLGIGGTLALAIRSDKGNQLDRRLVVDRTCTRVGNDFFGPENRTCADLASAKDTWTWIAAGALAAAGAAAVTTGILLATRDNGDGSRRRAGIDGVHLIASIADGKPYFEARWRF
jgi:hypothetical protein